MNLPIQNPWTKTPEQNGKAKRKNRTITTTIPASILTLLLHAKLPSRFWLDSFNTIVFLINRLPSQTLDMGSPYLRLYGRHLYYKMLHTLDFRCFPYLEEYRQHKLDPKSLPCVLIGYSSKHQGYICFYPPTKRVYTSRYVVFDESILPYYTPENLYSDSTIEGDLFTFNDP